MKILDAKITSINGMVAISWQMDNQSWVLPQKYNIEDATVQDPIKLKGWIQEYKDKFNEGKDIEDSNNQIPAIPPSVVILIDKPLNLE